MRRHLIQVLAVTLVACGGKDPSDSGKEAGGKADCGNVPLRGYVLPRADRGDRLQASAVAIGDLDGDGKREVVLTTTRYNDPVLDNQVFVFAQGPEGRFVSVGYYPYYPTERLAACTATPWICPPVIRANALELTDLDRDGFLDVVVGHYYGLSVLRGSSEGLEPASLFENRELNPVEGVLVSMDVDRDGNTDLIASTYGANGIGDRETDPNYAVKGLLSYRGRGDGTVEPYVILRDITWGGDLALTDLTGDGVEDLVVRDNGIFVYPHSGTSSGFTAPRLPVVEGGSLGTFKSHDVADLTGDGAPDVVAIPGDSFHEAGPELYPQTTDGFGPAVPLYPPRLWAGIQLLAAHDLDRDGDQDVVTAHGGWDTVSLYMQAADHSFSEPVHVPVPNVNFYDEEALAVGDVSSDGCPDVALADDVYGLVMLYGVCEDVNCDGRLDEMDLPW